jgi:hypothetical protein
MNSLGAVQNFGSPLNLNPMESAQHFPSRILAPKPVDTWWQFNKTFLQVNWKERSLKVETININLNAKQLRILRQSGMLKCFIELAEGCKKWPQSWKEDRFLPLKVNTSNTGKKLLSELSLTMRLLYLYFTNFFSKKISLS